MSVTVCGKLSRDPEMRYLPDGTPVTTMTIFVGNGKDAKDTPWKVTCWRKTAEWAAEWLHKDSVISATGSLTVDKSTGEPRMWEGKDGVTHTELNLNASNVNPIDNFGKGKSEQAPKPASKRVEIDYNAQDEIPF
jgi:single-strand DNA-binding protein